MDTVREGEGGTNGESGMETYPLPHVKQMPVGIHCVTQGAQTSAQTWRGGMRWEVGGRFQREGSYVYP